MKKEIEVYRFVLNWFMHHNDTNEKEIAFSRKMIAEALEKRDRFDQLKITGLV